MRPLQEKLKSKRSKASEAAKPAKPSKKKKNEAPQPTESPDGAFVELKWDRQEPTRPSNRQRALLGIAIGLLIAWWAALGWLVLDSL